MVDQPNIPELSARCTWAFGKWQEKREKLIKAMAEELKAQCELVECQEVLNKALSEFHGVEII